MAKRFAMGYFAVALLLIAALIAPQYPFGQSTLDVRLLVDRSSSMLRENPKQQSAAIMQALNSLPPTTQVELIDFSDRAELAIPSAPLSDTLKTALQQRLTRDPSDASPPGHVSDLEKGLNSALHPGTEHQQPVILLLTDGIQTHGDAANALSAAKQVNTPVFYLPLPRQAGIDAWISDLKHPAVARVGDRVTVSAIVTATMDAAAKLNLFAGGKLVSSTPVHLHAGENFQITIPYRPERAEPTQLKLVVDLPGDMLTDNDAVDSTLDVLGAPSVLYISQKPNGYLAQSLRSGNSKFRHVTPDASQALVAATANSIIVLDNVAADDLPASTVEELTTAVRQRGVGLIVLGGSSAFGAGAYRHSALESLLPVTSEPGLPQPKAAVLFVVDKSGSMEGDPDQSSRLALAQRAIVETARTFGPDDLVGLLAFDVSQNWLLPLASHTDPAGSVASAATTMRANGGTHLRAALEQAIDALAATTAQPRLLVLVTDGFSENDKISDLTARLTAKKIVLIALAVGADANTDPLEPVATASGGRVMQIVDVLRLPRLMRQQVEQHRKPSEIGRTLPQAATTLPFLPETLAWPPLDGYNVTKAKAEATVYLHAPRGDPLIAAHYFGAGRVVALPGGLGAWAGAWPEWQSWPRFAGNLAQWAAGNADDARFHIDLLDRPDSLEITVDTTDNHQAWLNDTAGEARITGPDKEAQTAAMRAVAPGRYSARVAAPLPGTYAISIRVGPYHAVRHITHHTPLELANPAVGSANLSRWEQQNLLEPWSAQRVRERTPRADISTRPIFLIGAGLVYLLLIAAQRGWLSRFGRRLNTPSEEKH